MKYIHLTFFLFLFSVGFSQTNSVDNWLNYFTADGGSWWSENQNYKKGNGQTPFHTYHFIWDEEDKVMLVEISGVDENGNIKSYWKGKTIPDYDANQLQIINESSFGIHGIGSGVVVNDSTYIVALEMVSSNNPKQFYIDTTWIKSQSQFFTKSYISDTSKKYSKISESIWFNQKGKPIPSPINYINSKFSTIDDSGFSLSQEIIINKEITLVWKEFTDTTFQKKWLGYDFSNEFKVDNEIIFKADKEDSKFVVVSIIPFKSIVLKELTEDNSIITYLLERINNKQTKLTFYQEVYSKKNETNKKLALKKVQNDQSLIKLKLLLEEN